MYHRLGRALDREESVYAASVVTLLLGLLFIFVWAPHPWGREGFDHYHDLALVLAAGRPFPTMAVGWGWYACVGLLLGIVPQFRPNLVLVPLLLAGYLVVSDPHGRGKRQALVLVLGAAVALMPWIWRNYRLTRMILPTSVHSSVQLW